MAVDTFGANFAAHRLDQPFGKRQAEPGAFDAAS